MSSATRILTLAMIAASCSSETIERGAIGDPCATAEDCATGAICAHDTCTRVCDAQGDCPVGFDCGIAAPGDAETTCYAATYDTSPGGFGTDCSGFAMECGEATDPCAAGFECLASEPCDPFAVCTTTCGGDTDCPPTMWCAAGTCARRIDCDECVIDDQCPAGSVCADDNGVLRCLHACGDAGDCHQPGSGSPFEECSGGVCISAGGSCVGDGSICAPCRLDAPDDCGADLYCFEDFTGERFCSQLCMYTVDAGGAVTADSCPTGSYCTSGLVQPAGTWDGTCTADPDRLAFTCYP